MTILEMHIKFKILTDKLDTLNYPNFEPEEIDELLNMSQERFITQRYGTTNTKKSPLESTQKRMDDLREVVKNGQLSVTTTQTIDNKENGYFVPLPVDYWFMINEEISLWFSGCNPITPASGELEDQTTYIVTSGTISFHGASYSVGQTFTTNVGVLVYSGTGKFVVADNKRVGVRAIQHDDYNRVIIDPFSKPWPNQVPRLMYESDVELLTDGTFQLENYYFRYIKQPVLMDISTSVDCELADHAHLEIVDMAAAMALEDIESQRYPTYSNELQKQE